MKTISRYIMTLALLITAASGAWAAITTEDIGKVICTDGSLYATKILAQNDGKTAAAMIGYVDTENNKALAIALTDGNNNMDWTQASEYCTGLNTSLPVPNGTWVLPTLEQWNSVLTLEEVVPGYEVYKSESLNTKLSAAKADALNNDGMSYWTCEETTAGGNYVKAISFNYGMASGGSARKAATDGSMTRAFLEIELSGIEVTTNAEEGETTFTEASFAMPAFDATADYELVRDMTYQVNAYVGTDPEAVYRHRVEKVDATTYAPVDITSDEQIIALFPVIDVIDAQNPKTLTYGTDYTLAIVDEQENEIEPADFDFAPGTYTVKVTGIGDYDGEIESLNKFELYFGYELTVGPGEFATFYKDEALTTEGENAELYTIASVTDDKAVLSSKMESVPANTPMLVRNNHETDTLTLLLIPTDGGELSAVNYAPEFQGTLTGTTIAASTEALNNYALNGKQFVWVMNAIEVAANKAWLAIPTSTARTITLVFDDATNITTTNITNITNGNWYDLNGRKLDKMPTKKGVYIMNGKKVVVK